MNRNLIFSLSLVCCNFLSAQNNISLLENSPFMPPGRANAANKAAEEGPASLAKLQLRGITSIDGEYIFSVYNPDTRESKWVSQGVEEDGIMIKSYDLKSNSVVIHSEAEDLSRQLQMNDYSASAGLRPTPNQVRRPPTTPQAPGTPAVNNTTTSLSRTQQAVQRPTRRNLETLRARRAELAEKLRKQPTPTNKPAEPTDQKR